MVVQSPSCSLQSIMTTECVISSLNFLRRGGKSLRTGLNIRSFQARAWSPPAAGQWCLGCAPHPCLAHSGQVHRQQESPGCEPPQATLQPVGLCFFRGEHCGLEKWAQVVTDRIWTKRHILHSRVGIHPRQAENGSKIIHLRYGENSLYKP